MTSLETQAIEKSSQVQPAMAGTHPTSDVVSRQSAIPASFPTDALGEVLGEAAIAIQKGVQCSPVIVGQSLLATAALAAQGHANIEIDGRLIPLSLFCMTISESGERKSTADRFALAPIQELQRECSESHPQEMMLYEMQHDRFKQERGELVRSKKPVSFDTLSEPQAPAEPIFLAQDPTLEGLHQSLHRGYRTQGCFNDEAAMIIGGHGMRDENLIKTLAGYSKLWDGSPIQRVRAGESYHVFNSRLSMHLMMQPIIAQQLRKPIFFEQGYLARFLIAEATPRAGKRLYNEFDPTQTAEYEKYSRTIKDLMGESLTRKDFDLIRLNPDAKDLWVQTHDEIEKSLGDGADLDVIKPTGAKMAENIARISGVLAIIDGNSVISRRHVESAIALGDFYIGETLKLSGRFSEDDLLHSANLLSEWIGKQPSGVVSVDDAQKSPRSAKARSAERFRQVMAMLEETGQMICVEHNGQAKPSKWKRNV
jgi:hypothetical protein